MKNRLLEDIGDSQSAIPARSVRRVQAAAAPPPPPTDVTAAAAPEALARQRAGVWRSRTSAPSMPPHAAQAPEPFIAPPARSAPEPRTAAGIAPEIASFSSSQPDWNLPLQPENPSWTERWGRKALGWTAGLAIAAALSATAAWMYHDTQVESTLAVVADHTTPAPPVAQAPPAPSPVPAPGTEAYEPPPLKLLPPEPVAAAPALAAAAPSAAPATPDAPAAAVPAARAEKDAPATDVPAVKRAPERRAAAASAERRRTDTRKAASRPARERVLARAAPARSVKPARPAAVVPPAPPAESPLAETLRLCRAAGYHATACLKRGCEATRFGLACRG